ncbi:MAG TPA: hypothetical protein VHN58_01280 [Croceicoccus sp.]|nr:hypothetical protein [Croceicoccus sp.]
MNAALFALAALVPAMVGPLPTSEPAGSGRSSVLVVRLCSGGTMTIPLTPDAPERPEKCQQTACHSGCNRKRLDPSQ